MNINETVKWIEDGIEFKGFILKISPDKKYYIVCSDGSPKIKTEEQLMKV